MYTYIYNCICQHLHHLWHVKTILIYTHTYTHPYVYIYIQIYIYIYEPLLAQFAQSLWRALAWWTRLLGERLVFARWASGGQEASYGAAPTLSYYLYLQTLLYLQTVTNRKRNPTLRYSHRHDNVSSLRH